MNTSPRGGTTIPNFKSGLISYVDSQGYSVLFQSLMTGGTFGTFRYEVAKQMMRQGIPIVIFCDQWTSTHMANSSTGTGKEQMFNSTPHALTVFGYREMTFTFANGTTRIDRYLQVSSGWHVRNTGFLRLNCMAIIDDAYAVSIY
jgi:hypothetical protein